MNPPENKFCGQCAAPRRTAAAAQAHFQEALQRAGRQGALSLELHCAIDLARLLHEQGRTDPARELLAPIYRRFTEGFTTGDLRAAETLLRSLDPSPRPDATSLP